MFLLSPGDEISKHITRKVSFALVRLMPVRSARKRSDEGYIRHQPCPGEALPLLLNRNIITYTIINILAYAQFTLRSTAHRCIRPNISTRQS